MKGLCAVVILLVCVVSVKQSYGARILTVFPAPSKSHLILGTALAKALAEKGHQVTMVSPYPLAKPMKNYRDIVMENPREVLHPGKGDEDFNMFDMRHQSGLNAMVQVQNMGISLTNFSLNDANFKKLINSGEKFDVIILEVFLDEAMFALGHHFQAPLVAFSTIGASYWVNGLTGNPSPYAYVPPLFLGYTDHMTFTERMIATLVNTFGGLYQHFVYIPKQQELVNIHFKNAPDLYTLMTNTSLVLCNSHTSLSTPKPHLPNMIEIGGFHVQPPKQLPADLQKYLDDAKDGVVYFSMGSNLRSKDMPKEKISAFLNAFSKLKQKVLWKWEDEKLPGQPPNVKLGTWLPQQDILAHPNVRVFITHGGLLSTTEAVSRGVPVIGIPIFGDQQLNMGQAMRLGYGLLLNFDNITTEAVSWALNEIIYNPKYNENAKVRSKVLNDRETKPIDTAVYWVEYIIRHKGARHLRSAAADLAWYQYLLVDVVACCVAILLLVAGTICFVLKKLCKLIFKSKDTKSNKSRKNKKD